jgi:hypothetical protein
MLARWLAYNSGAAPERETPIRYIASASGMDMTGTRITFVVSTENNLTVRMTLVSAALLLIRS